MKRTVKLTCVSKCTHAHDTERVTPPPWKWWYHLKGHWTNNSPLVLTTNISFKRPPTSLLLSYIFFATLFLYVLQMNQSWTGLSINWDIQHFEGLVLVLLVQCRTKQCMHTWVKSICACVVFFTPWPKILPNEDRLLRRRLLVSCTNLGLENLEPRIYLHLFSHS